MFQSLTGSIHTPQRPVGFLPVKACFNPSQVQFTLLFFCFVFVRRLVSIPHRFNSHIDLTEDKRGFVIVSIPHRFNSHCFFISITTPCWGFNPSQVQFTLRREVSYLEEKLKFQSLTGSIHTLRRCPIYGGRRRVSIPHRFNSHWKINLKRQRKE